MNLRTHFHRWMQYRENVRELSGCTDRELPIWGFPVQIFIALLAKPLSREHVRVVVLLETRP